MFNNYCAMHTEQNGRAAILLNEAIQDDGFLSHRLSTDFKTH